MKFTLKRSGLFLLCIVFLFSCKPVPKTHVSGYMDKMSYNVGDTFKLFLNANEEKFDYQLTINDINGNIVDTLICNVYPQKITNDLPYENGFGYDVTIESLIPNLKSGVYLFENSIPFVIKPNKKEQILVLYNSNTENAYCKSGGESLYSYDTLELKHKPKVSFLRPIALPRFSGEFFKWIETQKQYDIGYICDKDMDNYETLKDAKLLVIPGHSEYWTRKARRNFDKFVNNGNNALILSGNTMWWQVRYNDSKDQLICYRNENFDDSVDSLKTLLWVDTLLKYPIIESIGLDFDEGGYGLDKDNGWDGYKIVASNSPFFNDTEIEDNEIIKLATSEYDGAKLNFSLDSSKVTLNNGFSFYKYELIGYDLCSRKRNSNGAWIVLQRESTSGVIINTGSTNWCAKEGMLGEDSGIVKKVTLNMIDLMMQSDNEKMFKPQD